MKKLINELYCGLENESGLSEKTVLYEKEQIISHMLNEKISEKSNEMKKELLNYYLERRKQFILNIGSIEQYIYWYNTNNLKDENIFEEKLEHRAR